MGWRAYRAGDLGEDDVLEILMFCPRCADREFGPVGWEDPGEPPPSAMA
jgi:hypothetical protein